MRRTVALSMTLMLVAAGFALAQEKKQPGKKNAPQVPSQPPTYPDVKYGPYARNVMDVWLAKSDKPTPVLVSIHGGGFSQGNKEIAAPLLKECLQSGISVVAITYRLSGDAQAPAQFLDGARAIQFIRSKAKEWNLDPTKIAATGGSAGAGISLWLGFHDDFADPNDPDPVLRQSTRLTCMAVTNGQTSYDPRFIRQLFPGTETYMRPALAQLFGVDLSKLDELPKEKYKLFEECSPITHLTKDDAPALLIYGNKLDTPITDGSVGIHHPRFGKALKERMDALGIECQVATGVPLESEEMAKLIMDFVKRHFGMTATKNVGQKATKTAIPAEQVPDAVKQASIEAKAAVRDEGFAVFGNAILGVTNGVKTLATGEEPAARDWMLPDGRIVSGSRPKAFWDADKRQQEEIKQLIAQKKYELIMTTETPSGKQYRYRFTFADGSHYEGVCWMPLDNVNSWDDYRRQEKTHWQQRQEQINKAIAAGRFRLINLEARQVHVCQDVASQDIFEVHRIRSHDGKETADPWPCGEDFRLPPPVTETSWEDHLKAIRDGKRELLELKTPKTYTYQMTLEDGSKALFRLSGYGEGLKKPEKP